VLISQHYQIGPLLTLTVRLLGIRHCADSLVPVQSLGQLRRTEKDACDKTLVRERVPKGVQLSPDVNIKSPSSVAFENTVTGFTTSTQVQLVGYVQESRLDDVNTQELKPGLPKNGRTRQIP
jgi:hypothetical protein